MHKTLLGITKISLAIALLGSSFVTPSYAETSEWLDGSKFNRLMKKIGRGNKNIATDIKCKVGPGRAQSSKGTLLKVTYKPNPDEQKWLWAWGNQTGNFGSDAKSKGYRQVSSDGFKRESGLVTKCAVWHE